MGKIVKIYTYTSGSSTATGLVLEQVNSQRILTLNGTSVLSGISRTLVSVPTIGNNSFTYDGNEKKLVIIYDNDNDSELIDIIGNTSAVDVGNYQITFKLKYPKTCKWADNTPSDEKTYNWCINKMSLAIPTLNTNITLSYTGASQSPTFIDFDSKFMTVSDDSATNAGNDYTATISLIDKNNTQWANGGTDDIKIPWSIAKAAGFIVLNSTADQTIANGSSGTRNITSSHGGIIRAESSDTRYGTVSVSGTTITVTHTENTGTSSQTITITVYCDETDNYNTASISYNCTMAKSSCVSGDTLIMLGDGTEKPISELKRGDSVMTYNMDTGIFEPQEISIYWDENNAIVHRCLHLIFDNGKVVKLISCHGFFDKTLNTYVYINYNNYNEFINHDFVAYDKNGYALTKLIKAEMVEGIETQYSLETAFNDNFITEGILSMTQEPCPGRFEYFKFDENEIKWDAKDKQENIDKYGLYTWEEWKDLIPDEESFYAWNGPYFKILMGKGIVTMEDIYYMLEDASHGV